MTGGKRAASLLIIVLALLAGAPSAPAQQEPAGPFPIKQLAHRTYQLSCIDMESCLTTLGMLGYNTKAPAGQVQLDQLPVVFALPFKAPASLVGKSAVDAKQEWKDSSLTEETLSAPENRLMILYHESQSEQVARLEDLLTETVDVPDRQVLIEGMVIELTEDDLKELGVQWEAFGDQWLKVTFLSEEKKVPFVISYDPEFTPSPELAERITSTLRMVIQEGKGEVLSSPSVLVLNNRNARIKVVRDTPIISTKISFDIQNVDVRFEPVGIVLNIKPRISHDDSTVTMQIIAEVSEVPEGASITVEGTEVAPSIDRRIVETIARVHNNTPFIIGGLIRNEKARRIDRIPVLSRIPILGVLFRRSVTTREKREVIIVLTPRVIPIRGRHRPLMPKDDARFDFLDNRLFRNTYRIKAEDVFDVGFLKRNETVRQAFGDAKRLLDRRPAYADRSPFRELAQGVLPGEDAVVVRMIYEIVKGKLALHEKVRSENLIFFERDEAKPAGFALRWLGSVLKDKSPGGTLEGYYGREYPKEVLFLSYPREPAGGLEAALQAPAAVAEWVMVQDRDEVEERLIAANGLDEGYRHHEFVLAVAEEKDMERVKAAIAVREIAKVNDFEESLALEDFRVGRRFVIPEFGNIEERIFLIDGQVCELFYKSDFYYPALKDRLEKGYQLLEEALAREGL